MKSIAIRDTDHHLESWAGLGGVRSSSQSSKRAMRTKNLRRNLQRSSAKVVAVVVLDPLPSAQATQEEHVSMFKQQSGTPSSIRRDSLPPKLAAARGSRRPSCKQKGASPSPEASASACREKLKLSDPAQLQECMVTPPTHETLQPLLCTRASDTIRACWPCTW